VSLKRVELVEVLLHDCLDYGQVQGRHDIAVGREDDREASLALGQAENLLDCSACQVLHEAATGHALAPVEHLDLSAEFRVDTSLAVDPVRYGVSEQRAQVRRHAQEPAVHLGTEPRRVGGGDAQLGRSSD
jgi:hypothetical protein